MALYDGETIRIKATVTDFDGNPVTPTEISSAVVSLYDDLNNYVFQNVALSWNSTLNYFYYDWQDALPGTFTSLCVFTGFGYEVFDYGSVRVKPLKFTPTGDPTTIVN